MDKEKGEVYTVALHRAQRNTRYAHRPLLEEAPMKTLLTPPITRQSPPRRIAREPESGTRTSSYSKHLSQGDASQRANTDVYQALSCPSMPNAALADGLGIPTTVHHAYASTTKAMKTPISCAPQPMPALTFRSTDLHPVATTRDVHDGVTTLDSPLPANFPQPDAFAVGIARQGVEALLGLRPVRQLRSWFTASLYQAFTRKVSLTLEAFRDSGISAPTHPVRVIRIRCTRPRVRVAEAAVLVHDGKSLHAVAIRLEVCHGRWQVCAFEVA